MAASGFASSNHAAPENVGTDMHDIEMIDFELWVISKIRAACRSNGRCLPNIGRADELLDERLSLQRDKPAGRL
jgi:hypothetical protein